MGESGFIGAGMIAPWDAPKVGCSELVTGFIGGHVPVHSETEENEHVCGRSPVRDKVTEECFEKPAGRCRAADVLDADDNPFPGKLLVAKRRSADRVVKRGQKGGSFVDEFRMGHRANGVDDLPALVKRDDNFPFFKWKIYVRHRHYHFREVATRKMPEPSRSLTNSMTPLVNLKPSSHTTAFPSRHCRRPSFSVSVTVPQRLPSLCQP